MGRLTDLLNQRGMLDQPLSEQQDPSTESQKFEPLSEKISEEDLSDQVRAALKTLPSQYLSKRKVFQKLPSIADFYIPASLNGRVIQCAENSFDAREGGAALLVKAYRFDGYEVRYLYFDPSDQSLQKGSFEEFPKDGYGKTMGKLGISGDTLGWISKKSNQI